jgi:hypothetical protein
MSSVSSRFPLKSPLASARVTAPLVTWSIGASDAGSSVVAGTAMASSGVSMSISGFVMRELFMRGGR